MATRRHRRDPAYGLVDLAFIEGRLYVLETSSPETPFVRRGFIAGDQRLRNEPFEFFRALSTSLVDGQMPPTR